LKEGAMAYFKTLPQYQLTAKDIR